MKLFFHILFSFVFLTAQELPEIREHYYDASKTKQNAEQFHKLLSNYSKNNNIILAYKGASITIQSKFASGIKQKKQLFIEGATLVENAVKNSPENAEIRLIRLSIQENTPKILKYKANIEEDKKVIVDAFDKLPQDLKAYIKDYVKQSKVFTDKEKQQLLK
ncbi:hypothetical protein ACI6PS_04615 [Flavobacterium sp. PLA-1-15]|uniref:hypothetical protein n=1 Tax=Flavobacterium sp. PLA-1-15 TaxID=3380533 RepID=UPI003B7BEA48